MSSSRPRAGRARSRCASRTPRPPSVLEILPLTLEDHAQELDRVRVEPVPLPAGDLDETEPAPEERWLWRAEIAARLGGRPGAAALAPEVEAAVASLEAGFAEEPRSIRRSRMTRCRAAAPPAACCAASTAWASTAATTPSSGTSREASRVTSARSRSRSARRCCAPGFLAEKPSVGQRHVSLVAARTSEIRALVERGTCEEPLRSLLARLDRSKRPKTRLAAELFSPAASSVDGPGKRPVEQLLDVAR